MGNQTQEAKCFNRKVDLAIKNNVLILDRDKIIRLEQGKKYWHLSFPPHSEIVWAGEKSFSYFLDVFLDELRYLSTAKYDKPFYLPHSRNYNDDILLAETIINEMIEFCGDRLDLRWARNRRSKILVDIQRFKLNRRFARATFLKATVVFAFCVSSILAVAGNRVQKLSDPSDKTLAVVSSSFRLNKELVTKPDLSLKQMEMLAKNPDRRIRQYLVERNRVYRNSRGRHYR